MQTDKGDEMTRPQLVCRGVRGATTVQSNDPDAVLEATRELLYILIRANQIHPDDVASVWFTTTADITCTYPAIAARQMGWYDVALMCGHEMNVVGGLPFCIRILLNWNTVRKPADIFHVYLREAQSLRPDHKAYPAIPLEEIEAAVKHFDLTTLEENRPSAMSAGA